MKDLTAEVETQTILELRNVEKRFDLDKGFLETLKFKGGRFTREQRSVHAVNNVSLEVKRGEALCVVGESGCGKSTVARLVAGLLEPSAGEIHYDGQRIDNKSRGQLLDLRKKMQMIFQNPYASLNPRMTIQQALEEPVRYHNPGLSRGEVRAKVAEVMKSVGVDPSWSSRYPHEFSGGQRQRIAIARALTVDPEFIIADEPISALDVSIQAQVLNLMLEAKEERGLTYLFITHDLSVVEHFGTRVVVLYLGSVCELADTRTLFSNPKHPYTKALLSAVPQLKDDKPNHIRLKGEIPTPINLPPGCPFESRCASANARCREEKPRPIVQPDGAMVACHAVEEGRLSPEI
ncbi:Oligopeptide transport ATP-binding protein OppF [Pelagimonas phthalicica]|uniref:Oligopeptide transport ATP-binding protein OppF n=1 Tax=Pelagimonas phthalicica TaxID=1037362 RepID=A0A238JGX7_9RHOB|nr:oligopeptide/dipeptide ABC transporter ATP-binding protein [Pelagimonas phthalicica]TDS89172.1 peptide/nickel transport system ATP-binding protein [Pelagimonas phthalicica]SMX29653.1 Oligopeptide transport ATP-binding protein OppF [Pelagimonas phthalicica]